MGGLGLVTGTVRVQCGACSLIIGYQTVRRTPLIRKCLSGQGSQTGALERRLLRSRLFQSNVTGDSTGELVIRNRLD